MGPSLRTAFRVAAALTALAPFTLRAQQRVPAPPPAGAGTVVGVVVDTLGQPIAGVAVYVEGRAREAITRADGIFRFDSVKTRSVTIATRRAGFFPRSEEIAVSGGGVSVVIELMPRLTALAPVVTEATLSGLSGIVSDSVTGALAGAVVVALGGSRASTKTDSAGMFFMDIKAGQYMVRVVAKDHVAQEIGVTVPPKGGRRIAVRLTPGADPYRARAAAYADELKDRLARRSTVYSKVYTREDVTRLNPPSVHSLAVHGAPMVMGEGCFVYINGGITQVPLWALDPAEIEFMEVYAKATIGAGGGIRPRGTTSLRGMGRVATQVTLPKRTAGLWEACPEAIFVWTAR